MKKVVVVVGSCKVSGFPSEPAATYLIPSVLRKIFKFDASFVFFSILHDTAIVNRQIHFLRKDSLFPIWLV